MRDLPADPDPSPLAPSPYSPPLAVTGVLMLAALFAVANPAFGIREQSWPWEFLAEGHHSLRVVVTLYMWTALAFWCVGMAFSGAPRVRALGTAMVAAPLLIQACSTTAGLAIEYHNLNKMVPLVLLGGGLLVAREPTTRGLGSLLAGSGALLLLWALASGFAPDRGGSQLVVFFEELGTAVKDPSHDFGRKNHLWWSILPQTLMLLAALGGLLAAVGVRSRLMLTIAFWVLLAGIIAPGVAGSILYLLEGAGISSVLDQAYSVLIGHGALLWMLGVFTLQDFGKVRSLAETA